MLEPDFRDMLSAFNDARVEYLVVGAFAMAAHGLPRATGDLDVWVRATPDNATRIVGALAAFGAPSDVATAQDFTTPDIVVQIGTEPLRIDILTTISGVEFGDAYPARVSILVDGVVVPILGLAHLAQNKRAAGRSKDLLDVEWIEATYGPQRAGSAHTDT